MQKPRSGARQRTRFLGAVCALTLTAAGCGPGTPGERESAPPMNVKKDAVVYGTDDRQDVYAHPDATLRSRAQQATVALVFSTDMDATNPNNITFPVLSLQEWEGLCPSERFLSDPSAAFCSGTLIDDDLVLTAGHCITNTANDPETPSCANTRFVFKYYNTAPSTLETITSADVFNCKQVVVRQTGLVGNRELDYAIVRLDRSAAPRFTPAPVRAGNNAMAVDAQVAVIGSGSGIPFKIDAGGKVRDARASTLDWFEASTDTFSGNSGSGVYELGGHTVAGILVTGDTDYVPHATEDCYVVNVCPESGCLGEGITYVRPAIDGYCAVASSTRLCGATPPPPAAPGSYSFTATDTANATRKTVNKKVALLAGQSLTVGTCGVAGAALTGDTFLRMVGPGGAEVAANDDACGGRGSQFTVTATVAGDYEVRAGCYGTGSCGGTVAWVANTSASTSGTFDFTASGTNSAQQNTVNQDIPLAAGKTLTVGTCGVPGASATGDTYLRLFNPAGVQVALNDDGCGGSGSKLTYTVPAGAPGGAYQVRAGCYGATSCSGKVAWTVQ
jgi:V8-like Glu-specific endopeptidase